LVKERSSEIIKMLEHRITFQPMGISCKARAGQTIIEVAGSQGIEFRSDCGGQGKCGKCPVEVTPLDHVSSLTSNESELLSADCIKKGGRLACETKIAGPLSVSVSESVLDSKEAIGKSLDDTILTEEPSRVLNRTDGPGSLGIAVDLGTTTLALYLCDLQSGAILHSEAEANPQRRYGEDVISRIAYTNDNADGLEDLRRVLIEAINKLIDQGLGMTSSTRGAIEKVTVVGNTSMQHLFAGLHPGKLGVILP